MKRMFSAIIALTILLGIPAAVQANTGTTTSGSGDAGVQVFTIEVAVSPTPTPTPIAAPAVTPAPELVIRTHGNTSEDIEYLALQAWWSPCQSAYEKFKLWSITWNRTKCTETSNGVPVYAKTIKEVVSNKYEFAFWSSKSVSSDKLDENRELAILFLNYIKTCEEDGRQPLIPRSGVLIGFAKNDQGLNRYVDAYKSDGTYLIPTMTEDEFNQMILGIEA